MESEPARHLRPVQNTTLGPVIGSCPFRNLDGQVCNREVRRRNQVGAPPKYCDDPTHNARNARANEEKLAAAAESDSEEAAPMPSTSPSAAPAADSVRVTELTVRLEESERARFRAEDQADKATETIEGLHRRIEALHEAHSRSLVEIQQATDARVRQAEQSHHEAIQDILAQHRVEMASERDRLSREMQSERMKHEQDLEHLRGQVTETRQELWNAQQSLAFAQSTRWSANPYEQLVGGGPDQK